LEDFKQKYNNSQTELNSTKNELAAEQAKNHASDLKINGLNDEMKNKNDQITELQKRPNISNDDWIKDYSQRPTKAELNKIESERDSRPNISLEDYQKLSTAKGELDK